MGVVAAAGRGEEHRHDADGKRGDVAGQQRERALLRPSAVKIFCGGQTRARPGFGLSEAEGDALGRSGKVAGAVSELRSGGGSTGSGGRVGAL